MHFAQIAEIKSRRVIMDDDVVKYVRKSTYRTRTIKVLDGTVLMPKEIAEDSGILQNHISNVLRELKEKNLVECLNPKMKKGRLYRLTEDGQEILDEIKD
jgi:DNA-binding MarR family transcriptional regulator